MVNEFWYAWDGSVELMVDTFYPLLSCFWPGEEEAVVRRRIAQTPVLKYNPTWLVCVLALAIMMIPGHMFHSLLGNGEKLRSDELDVETAARVGWVYTYSGSFLMFAAFFAVKLMMDSTFLQDWNGQVVADMMAFAIVILYVAGDAHLLFQMRRKNTIMTHACVISRVTFGLAFFLVLVQSLFHTCGFWHYVWSWHICWDQIVFKNLVIACIFCVFMSISAIGYYPLLEIDYKEEPVNPPPPWGLWFSGFLSALGPLCVTIVIGISGFMGHFGDRPLILMSAPFIIIVTVTLLRVAVYGFAWERIWATLVALGPLLLVTGSFSIAGPKLWSLLSGSNPHAPNY